MPGAVDIVLDAREHALNAAMAPLCPSCSVKQLDIGDVHIAVDGVLSAVVERKTIADLAASVKDGRYAEQKARLSAFAASVQPRPCTVVYVIEREGKPLAFDQRMRGVGAMPAATLQGCFMSLFLRTGTRVVVTEDVQDTAAFLLRLADRLGDRHRQRGHGEGRERESERVDDEDTYATAACRAAAVSSRKRDNVDVQACFRHQLAQIPGVAASIAGGVCAEYGSMCALYARLAALPREERLAALGRVPLVGPKIAAKLDAYLFTPTQ